MDNNETEMKESLLTKDLKQGQNLTISQFEKAPIL